MSQLNAFQRYRQLLDKVDAKVAEINGKYSGHVQCAVGCHACCQPELSVSVVEREFIRDHVIHEIEVISRVQQLTAHDPHGGMHCSLLDETGTCSIYEVRPIICRSQGMPLATRLNEHFVHRDVCPLNFTAIPLDELELIDLINLDTLNTLLALINHLFYPERKERRYLLHPDSLFGD